MKKRKCQHFCLKLTVKIIFFQNLSYIPNKKQ